MSRRPALDGLRGLAVLAVMMFHTSPAAHGGFMGVDIFFVISGYLITTLLLLEWARTGGVDLRSFYIRRSLRLAPALLFMLLLATPLIIFGISEEMHMPMAAAVASVLFYVANWASVAVNDGLGPLTHTWSLAIEEQFYLIWPLVLIAILARRRRPPVISLAVLIVIVVVARWICWDLTHGAWLYYATTSHSDGLLIGALLAIVLQKAQASAPVSPTSPETAPIRLREPSFQALLAPAATPAGAPVTTSASSIWPSSTVAAWFGMAGIAALMATLHIDSNATFQYGLPLIALFTALVVWHLATETSGLLIWLLSLRPLTIVGTVSYGLYLYHFPVFHFIQKQGYSHPVQHALELSISAAVTAFSWFVVEKPALRLKDRFIQRGSPEAPVIPSLAK
ncbi:MAG TPA: acyltransferase [Kineosporiaceae bacterium]|nr:acyltransferase [Kineosporiaceae bacterium]